MTSLLDIVPSTRKVALGEQSVEVRGLGLTDLAYLLNEYPEVKVLFAGGAAKFSIDTIVETAPKVAVDIIACGTGNRGSERALLVAEALPVSQQYDLLEAIIDESFRSAGGLGPFVKKVASLLGADVDVDGIMALASNSPKQQKR